MVTRLRLMITDGGRPGDLATGFEVVMVGTM